MATTGLAKQSGDGAIGALILEMHVRRTSYWVWPRDVWLDIFRTRGLDFANRYGWTTTHARHALVAATYLLGLFDDFRALGIIDRTALACRIFGRVRIEAQIKQVIDVIRSWGFSRFMAKDIQWALCTVLLANKSPRFEDLTLDLLRVERDMATVHYRRASIVVLSRALVHLGVIDQEIEGKYRHNRLGDARNSVDPVWVEWVERWYRTCTIQANSRQRAYHLLLKAGRWLTQTHPDCTSPKAWTRELARSGLASFAG